MPGLGVTQGQWKWHHSIDYISLRFLISLPLYSVSTIFNIIDVEEYRNLEI